MIQDRGDSAVIKNLNYHCAVTPVEKDWAESRVTSGLP